MKTINFPANADSLSVKVTLTGILNSTGSLEYFNTDSETSLWGPLPFSGQLGSREYTLVNKPGETAAQQDGRYAFVLAVLENYGDTPAGATASAEFFAVTGETRTSLGQPDMIFDGDVPAKSEKSAAENYLLKKI